MFSDNQRITAAQMKLLLITDWAGKMMLVVPGMLGHIGARNAVLAAAAGTLLAAGAARGFGSIRIGKSRDYYSLLQMHLGTLGAAAVYLVYGIYLTGHTGLMLYLSGQVTGNYLLPGIAPAVTAVIPAVLGTWIAAEGIEVRGRVSELTGRIIWVLVFLLLFLAMRGIRPELLEYSGGVPDMQALTGTLSVAAVFGTLSVLPLVSSRIESPRKMGRKAAEAVVLTGNPAAAGAAGRIRDPRKQRNGAAEVACHSGDKQRQSERPVFAEVGYRPDGSSGICIISFHWGRNLLQRADWQCMEKNKSKSINLYYGRRFMDAGGCDGTLRGSAGMDGTDCLVWMCPGTDAVGAGNTDAAEKRSQE